MNKRAIALATDSAVTIGSSDKFYNTANKLFMLSKYHPVGIMIYNNAEFMGMPWEIIIKQYRDSIGDQEFDNLQGYCNSFLNFLKNEALGLSDYEEIYFIKTVRWFLNDLNSQIRKHYNEAVEQTGNKLEEHEIKNIINNTIDEYDKLVDKFNDLDNIPDRFEQTIEEKYRENLLEVVKSEIPVALISEDSINILAKTCIKVFKKAITIDTYSGIVIAGFGKKDLFPSLIEHEICGIINGYIRLKVKQERNITISKNYDIVPFAQSDTVDTFLNGISPRYSNVLNDSFNQHIISVIDSMDSSILNETNKVRIKDELNKKWNDVTTQLVSYSNTNYLFPILSAVISLPIEELATMAESLVNLTSFKRQVAIDEYSRTVGGPIDVAVISKGDGFVWIKRKHYFKPEHNHHFFKTIIISVRRRQVMANKSDSDKFFIRYLRENYCLKDTCKDNNSSDNTKESVKKMLDKEFAKKK